MHYNEEQISADLTICEDAKRIGIMTACVVAGGGVRATGRGMTTLFRAVSKAEYKQILKTSKFEVGPNSYEGGKFFAESLNHANQWGQKFYGSGNFYAVEARVSSNVADQMIRWPKLDGIGPARFGTFDQLENANIGV